MHQVKAKQDQSSAATKIEAECPTVHKWYAASDPGWFCGHLRRLKSIDHFELPCAHCYSGITAGSVIKMSLIKDVLIHLAGVNQNVQRVPAHRQQSTFLMNNLCSQQPSLSAVLKISTFVYVHSSGSVGGTKGLWDGGGRGGPVGWRRHARLSARQVPPLG